MEGAESARERIKGEERDNTCDITIFYISYFAIINYRRARKESVATRVVVLDSPVRVVGRGKLATSARFFLVLPSRVARRTLYA